MGDADQSGGGGVAWRTASGQTGGSRLWALGVAIALGVLGPGLVVAASRGLVWVSDGITLTPGVALLLILAGLVGIPYVCLGGLGLAYLKLRGFDWGEVRSYLGVGWPGLRGFAVAIGGAVVIFVLSVVALILVQILGIEAAQNQTFEGRTQAPELLLLLVPVMLFVVGPTEELLYRGVVQSRLREALAPAPAIVIASAIFAPAHIIALTGDVSARLTTIVILFFPSLVFGVLYEYAENLVVPILTHGIYNSIVVVLVYAGLKYGASGQLTTATTLLLAGLPV